ncbi:MAG: hypothetical protein KAI89_06670 [Emcibacter sp.]|nr:hypothetical protein [Emcibacter sp.]
MVLSTVCTLFFAMDVFGDMVLGRDFPTKGTHHIIELFVVIISLASFVFHFCELNRFFKRHNKIKDQMRVASGEFSRVIEDLFIEWALTPAEKDVAIYLIKGMSFADIAAIRNAKEGTVKAQSNSLYRKAGVKGCHELLALFLDELLTDLSIR